MVLFERLLETMLFSSRFLVMMAVFGSIAASGCMFLKGLQTVQKAAKDPPVARGPGTHQLSFRLLTLTSACRLSQLCRLELVLRLV